MASVYFTSKPRTRRARLQLEELEPRRVLSLIFGPEFLGGGDNHGSGSAIRLDLVALHEFGHSLGLGHDSSSTLSIMDPYYNATFDINYFLSGADPAVTKLRSLFSDARIAVNTTSWKDSLDPYPYNGVVEVTYSFMKDGARMDKGTSTLFKTMNGHFGSPSGWQPIFTQQLTYWAQVSDGNLAFLSKGDEAQAYSFNISGNVQNDLRFGDIRIGSHRFDGSGKVLAHAYYPPPNGATAAGDAHFDNAENWTLSSGSYQSSGNGSGGRGNLEIGFSAQEDTAILAAAVRHGRDAVDSMPLLYSYFVSSPVVTTAIAALPPVLAVNPSWQFGVGDSSIREEAPVINADNLPSPENGTLPIAATMALPATLERIAPEELNLWTEAGSLLPASAVEKQLADGQAEATIPTVAVMETEVTWAALALVFASMPAAEDDPRKRGR